MAEITLKGNPIQTFGDLPEVGTKVQDFTLTGSDFQELFSESMFLGET